MPLAEKHPHDENKYQSTFNDYGHGPGNGKSRNAVYKHHKKWIQTESESDFVQSESKPQTEEADFVQSDSVNIDKDSTPEPDFVQDKSSEWGSISWADDEGTEPQPRTIPKPLADVAKGKMKKVSTEATGQMVRFGYVGLDRMLTHWGRGVMSNPAWAVERSPQDYDALESSTVALLAHYGIEVPLSPLMVWGATVGAAYGPPVMYVRKNADPNRIKGRFLRRLFGRLNVFKRRKKPRPMPTQNQGDDDEIRFEP